MLVAVGIGFFYLITRVSLFSFFNNRFSKRRTRLFLVAALLAVIFAVFSLTLGFMNAMVIFLHAIIIWLVCDGVAFIWRKTAKKARKKYISGAVAIIVTALYLSVAVFFAFYVFRTEYTLKTGKDLGAKSLKIVGFSDSHIGVTISGKGLKKYVDKINAENPDIVIIVGDFVDDATEKYDMENACESLKNLKSKYGTFFVFGNHDSGYYSASKRGYNRDDIIKKLTENGVTVLEDEAKVLDGKITVVGRRDKQNNLRLSAQELSKKCSGFSLVLDHQPNDYKNEAQAGFDLVVSGHTHGGQLIPINRVGELIGANDATYGYSRIKNTDFIVSSGISNWELYFKSGCISEYFVLNIIGKE